jgi:hypothetical protein
MKFLTIIKIAVFFFLAPSFVFGAQSGLFTYTVLANEASITAYPSTETGHLQIPATLDGFPVKKILGPSLNIGAFQGSQLNSVTIPEGVTVVGNFAFYFSRIKTITFPSTLKEIGANAFGLGVLGFGGVPVVLPNGLNAIGQDAFFACDIAEIVIPDSVTTIGIGAFRNCSSLKVAELGRGLIDLPGRVFEKCEFLHRVFFKEGLKTIGANCFDATNIAEIEFPSTLTSIGDQAFGFGTSASINGGHIRRAIFKGNAPTIGTNTFAGQSSEFVVNYRNTATGFTEPLWMGLRSHKVAVLPSNALETEGLFTYRVIDDEIEIVGFPKDFTGHVEIPTTIEAKSVTGITGAYRGNVFEAAFPGARLSSVTIPEGVEIIGHNAFAVCPNLKEVKFPDSLKIIGPSAFYRTIIEKLEFGSNLRTIGEFSFPNIVATEMVIPDSVIEIRPRAFESSRSRSLILGSSVNKIGSQSLVFNYNLRTILFKGNVPADTSGLSAVKNNNGLIVYYFSGANGFTTPKWDVNGNGKIIFNTVELGAPLKPAENWLLTKGLHLTQDMDATLAGSNHSVLLSYALNMNPYQTDLSLLPGLGFSNGHLKLSYYAGRSDVTYQVEKSINLSNWDQTGLTISGLDAMLMQTAIVNDSDVKKFLRLKVTLD